MFDTILSVRELQILGEVALSMLLAAVLGFEREVAQKPAGIRTHMLVGGSATLLVGMGYLLVERSLVENPQEIIAADPIRIVQAIVIGVSFLGTGTIVRGEGTANVHGLTTAASLLMTSGIGIAIALSQEGLAIATTVLVVIVLRVLGSVERLVGNWTR